MYWLERKIRRYEHRRWAQEPDRRTLPFAWGLAHIGGDAHDSDPRAFLDRFVETTVRQSDEWYAASPADDYAFDGKVLTFTSGIRSPWPENNRVHAQLFRARRRGPAVVVLAQWNARWEEQQDVCQGYERLGILGTSIGSSIAFIAMCHEPALRAGAFLHVANYFGDVVASGLTTMNVWEPLQTELSSDDLRRYWSPISPFPYISKLHGRGKKLLAISGRYDPTFWPQFTNTFFDAIRHDAVHFERLCLPCGHYSLGVAPFKYAAGYRFGTFLRRALG